MNKVGEDWAGGRAAKSRSLRLFPSQSLVFGDFR